jgi:hypothetical protein
MLFLRSTEEGSFLLFGLFTPFGPLAGLSEVGRIVISMVDWYGFCILFIKMDHRNPITAYLALGSLSLWLSRILPFGNGLV